MKYFGFDLGDGESCIAWSRALGTHAPQPIPINGELSFVTAVGKFDGRTVIGSHAANNADVEGLQVCFKRDFLHNLPHVNQALEDFVRGVLEAMRQDDELAKIIDDPEEACFVVGCPAGWKPEDRKRYRDLLQRAGMKNVRLASESRAAFEYALRSRSGGVNAGTASDSVLVADIGSSTLDFAFVAGDEEHNVSVAGDTHLGGGLLDEMIVIHSLQALMKTDQAMAVQVAAVLEKSASWRSRVMLQARLLKEQYFTNEEYYQTQTEPLTEPVKIFTGGRTLVLPLSISTEIVEEHLIGQPHPSLENHSFRSRLANNLIAVRQNVTQKLRELAEQQGQDKPGKLQMLILTGGASRMGFFRKMCHKEFVGVPVVVSDEPEFDIARGLAYAGSVDESAAQLIREIREYISGSAAETAVSDQLPELARSIAYALGEVLMEQCVKPTFTSWKHGTISTLANFEIAVNASIEGYMTGKRAESVMRSAIDPWAEKLMNRIQEDLDKIASKYRVNLGSMQLNGLLVSGAGAGEVKMVSAFMNTIQALVTVISTVVCTMICGGAGLALLSSLGPAGPVVGAIVGFLAALKGTQYAKEKVMNMDLPLPLRKLMPTGVICSSFTRQKIIDGISDSIKTSPEMNEKLVKQIAGIIDDAITETLQECEVRFVA